MLARASQPRSRAPIRRRKGPDSTDRSPELERPNSISSAVILTDGLPTVQPNQPSAAGSLAALARNPTVLTDAFTLRPYSSGFSREDHTHQRQR